MRHSEKTFRLVQEGFSFLGYPVLEDVCEQNGGFTGTCLPAPLINLARFSFRNRPTRELAEPISAPDLSIVL